MGVMPKITNTDPWQIMQAFAHEGHRNAYGRGYGRNGNRYIGAANNSPQAAPTASSSAYDDALSDYNQDKGDYSDPGPPPSPMMTRPMPQASGTSPIGIAGNLPLMIQKSSIARGIDPNVSMAVVRSEGGLDGKFRIGDGGSSGGPFQLHQGGIAGGGNAVGGLGDEFVKKYGHIGPDNVQDQIDFALDNAKKSGWGAWHGYKGGAWDGINRGPIADSAPADVPLPPQRPGDLPQQVGQADPQQGMEAQQVADNDPNVDEVDPASRLSWLA